MAGFAYGVGNWLNLTVSGQPQFGKSPDLVSLRQAAQGIGKKDLALTSGDADRLARKLGATRAAVGTLTGMSARCRLTYQMYAIPEGKRIGASISVNGTEDQIAAQLPKIAHKMVATFGASLDPSATGRGLTGEQIAYVGGLDLNADPDRYTPADQKRIEALAAKSPYAGVVELLYAAGVNERTAQNAVAQLMALTPSNSLVTSLIDTEDTDALFPYASVVENDCVKFPNNCEIAATGVGLARVRRDAVAERKEAESEVRCSPRSSGAWLDLAETISFEADRVRHGRTVANLSQSEQAYLERLAPDWEACAERATELDPDLGAAWERLATAALSNGDYSLAGTAFWNACRMDPNKAEVYALGLQMYRDKASGDPQMLAKVANLAANASYDSPAEVRSIVDELGQAGFDKQGGQLIDRSVAAQKTAIARHPSDGELHFGLASLLLTFSGNDAAVKAEYAKAERMLPDDPTIHGAFGRFCDRYPEKSAAIAEYHKALAIDPDNKCLYDLGNDLKEIKKSYVEAGKDLARAITLWPDDAKAYCALGELYHNENHDDKAVDLYAQALAIRPWWNYAYDMILWLLDNNGKWNDVLKYGKVAVTYYPTDLWIVDSLADAYLQKKQWALSERLSRYAVSLKMSDASAHEHMAEALVQEGHRDEAFTEWKTVLALGDPGEAPVAQKMLSEYGSH